MIYNKWEDLPFKYIIPIDFEFEFGGRDGERPRPVCMVAKELRSGQEWRIRRGQFGSVPPFPTGTDTLFIVFFGSAEFGSFKALGEGWPAPARILDLFVEFRNHVNGVFGQRSLIEALTYFGCDTIALPTRRR
jgi:DNA polymerase I